MLWERTGGEKRQLGSFWATHVNRKWAFFSFNMPCRYQICIAECLYPYKVDLPRNLFKITDEELKKKSPLPVDVRRSKKSRLKLRAYADVRRGRWKEGKGRGDWGEKEFLFFFSTPLPFLRMPRRLRDTWGCLFFSDKNSRPAFFLVLVPRSFTVIVVRLRNIIMDQFRYIKRHTWLQGLGE